MFAALFTYHLWVFRKLYAAFFQFAGSAISGRFLDDFEISVSLNLRTSTGAETRVGTVIARVGEIQNDLELRAVVTSTCTGSMHESFTSDSSYTSC